MLSRKYHRCLHFIALFAILFASLAPTVSHALAASTGNSSFTQTLCTSNGEKVIIQVMTSKGKQLSTALPTNPIQKNSAPNSMGMHIEHCPFCGAASANIAIAPESTWILVLSQQAEKIDFDFTALPQPSFIQAAHPPRAPPAR